MKEDYLPENPANSESHPASRFSEARGTVSHETKSIIAIVERLEKPNIDPGADLIALYYQHIEEKYLGFK